MGGWGIVVRVLVACSSDPESAVPEDSGGYGGLDREQYDRLYRERFCAEWEICSTGGPCPLTPGAEWLPYGCDYDADAGQACVVGAWSCASGSSYPVEPDPCGEVCRSSTSSSYGFP